MYDVIITAAGVGARTNLTYNKIFVALNGKPCIVYSIEAFLQSTDIANIYLTIQPNDEVRMQAIIDEYRLPQNRIFFVYGGKTRQESVYAALQLVKAERVMIHDGARPFVPLHHFNQVNKKLAFDKAVIFAIRATDTIKEMMATDEVNKTVPREKLVYAQTPQCFDTDFIKKCHEQALSENFSATDDAQLVEVFGGDEHVQIVPGTQMNMKITSADDIKLADLIARNLD